MPVSCVLHKFRNTVTGVEWEIMEQDTESERADGPYPVRPCKHCMHFDLFLQCEGELLGNINMVSLNEWARMYLGWLLREFFYCSYFYFCVHVCVLAHMHARCIIYVEDIGQPWVAFLRHHLFVFVRKAWNSSTRLGRPQGSAFLCFSRARIISMNDHAWLTEWVLGIKLRFSCLQNKHFSHWVLSPAFSNCSLM